MAEITSLADHKSRDTIAALRELLARAERGTLRGLAFAVKTGAKRHHVGLTGDYCDNPFEALAAATRMEYKANQLISALYDEPETHSMPL